MKVIQVLTFFSSENVLHLFLFNFLDKWLCVQFHCVVLWASDFHESLGLIKNSWVDMVDRNKQRKKPVVYMCVLMCGCLCFFVLTSQWVWLLNEHFVRLIQARKRTYWKKDDSRSISIFCYTFTLSWFWYLCWLKSLLYCSSMALMKWIHVTWSNV